ncbi:hypothetical protein yc1106_08355 [Curvularia clavata]|uniref:Methyltransferase type 12 domain-containing protein n=1 Tax=Curvularia clavata TaxID=95742 RepID=A0A9Q9DX24_CURCL|nr:hypothetical protein yc1106_08355 [Curvularia clavata]
MGYADANRVYFDSISNTYDTNPTFAKVNLRVTEAWRAHVPWIGIPLRDVTAKGESTKADGQQVRLLDYACGTGLMTNIFSPYIHHATGIDVSPKMLSVYTSRFESSPSHLTITPVLSNLLDASDPSPTTLSGPQFWNYDLAAVGFGFHHFEDATFAARQLKQRLRPGGVLVINDFLEGGDLLADEEGKMIEGSEGNHAVHKHGHKHHHGHGHHHDHGHASHSGHSHDHHAKESPDASSSATNSKMHASIVVPNFSEAGIRKIFTDAGFVDVDVVVLKEKYYMEFGGNKLFRTIFFAQGKRPVAEEEKSEL